MFNSAYLSIPEANVAKKIFWPITVGQTSFYILDFGQNNCLHIVSSNFEVNYTDGIFCGLRRAV